MGIDKEILIAKWLSGNSTDEEASQLLKWAEENDQNQRELKEAERLWKLSRSLKKDRDEDVHAAWKDFTNRTGTVKKRISFQSYAMAATLALIVSMAFITKYFIWGGQPDRTPIVATAAHKDTFILQEPVTEVPGEDTFKMSNPVLKPLSTRKKSAMIAVNAGDSALVFTLPDGSTVYLNRNSKLTYPEHFEKGNRLVALSGEAFFEVTKNQGEFVVTCQDTKTRVLGTSFNIRGFQPNNQVEVTVVTGLVEVTNFRTNAVGKQLLLQPGEQGTFNPVQNLASKSTSFKKDKWWKKKNFRSRIKQFFNKITNRKSK